MICENSITVKGDIYSVSTGKWARQANGSVVLKWRNLTLMASATASNKAKSDMDFFPLTIDYREKFYAGGKFVGGFFKREGKPSNREVLTARLTDRPIRPMFPKNFLNEVQIFITLLSMDSEQVADIHAVTCASAALITSNMPFETPVAGVHVGRIDGEIVIFPSKEQIEQSDINLLLAGSEKTVTMIEGSAKEVSEKDILEAIKAGHEEIKQLCKMQEKLKEANTQPELPTPEIVENTELQDMLHQNFYEAMKEANQAKDKQARIEQISHLNDKALSYIEQEYQKKNTPPEEIPGILTEASKFIEKIEVEVVREQIFKDGVRADMRSLDTVRPINIEVGVLPSVHGSAVFTRGETQSLGVVTLGSSNHAQPVNDVHGEYKESFYLHYNFLPFSVGEVRRYGGPGRREIGHGKLAENAVRSVIPSEKDFPYVIRVVSEILESNGSSSMATVCSASLAMMDAGVPIKNAVAGIAMGLITDDKDNYAILSDIAGLEDHFGDMDFKVAGTENGITAFQLDTKVEGISHEIMEQALEQAKKGRYQILVEMNKVIAVPRDKVSKNAPVITRTTIPSDKIGELIGPGGSNIRSLMERTQSEITVQDDGTVYIHAKSQEASQETKILIDLQFEKVEIGKIYEGTVQKIVDFGAFIEILPNKSGLCHISQIADKRINTVADYLEEGQNVSVKVLNIDRQGKISLSIKEGLK